MTLGSDHLVLCAGTLGDARLGAKLEAAAAAGFDGVSVFIHELARARAEEGLEPAAVRARAEGLGLSFAELDPLLDWLPAAGAPQVSDAGTAMAGFGVDDFLDAGEALGVRMINSALFGAKTAERDQIVEGFAGLCDRAAERGLRVTLEFVAFSQVPDLATAHAIVEAAGRDNGGVMFDTIHHLRSGGGADDIARSGARVLGIQLNDAPLAAAADPVFETMHERLLPGEGEADPAGMLRALDAAGCRAPVGIEVFSDRLFALPSAEAARLAYEAGRQLLVAVRAP